MNGCNIEMGRSSDSCSYFMDIFTVCGFGYISSNKCD